MDGWTRPISVTALLGHPGPWTFADLERLPDDGNRYEVVDGTLVVSPTPSAWHQEVAERLLMHLRAQAGPDWRAGYELAVIVGDDGRIPDLALVRGGAPVPRAPARYRSDDFGLVVEVVSPSSRTTDRLVKQLEYAPMGVPFYWRVETEPVEVVAYRRVDGAYVESGRLPPAPARAGPVPAGRGPGRPRASLTPRQPVCGGPAPADCLGAVQHEARRPGCPRPLGQGSRTSCRCVSPSNK